METNQTDEMAAVDQSRLVSGSFTPGPWRVRACPRMWAVDTMDIGGGPIMHTDIEANARLIAAAPEMLKALEAADECLALIEDVGHGAMMDNVTVARRMVIAAISSANAIGMAAGAAVPPLKSD